MGEAKESAQYSYPWYNLQKQDQNANKSSRFKCQRDPPHKVPTWFMDKFNLNSDIFQLRLLVPLGTISMNRPQIFSASEI
jgi:hypothetical protein